MLKRNYKKNFSDSLDTAVGTVELVSLLDTDELKKDEVVEEVAQIVDAPAEVIADVADAVINAEVDKVEFSKTAHAKKHAKAFSSTKLFCDGKSGEEVVDAIASISSALSEDAVKPENVDNTVDVIAKTIGAPEILVEPIVKTVAEVFSRQSVKFSALKKELESKNFSDTEAIDAEPKKEDTGIEIEKDKEKFTPKEEVADIQDIPGADDPKKAEEPNVIPDNSQEKQVEETPAVEQKKEEQVPDAEGKDATIAKESIKAAMEESESVIKGFSKKTDYKKSRFYSLLGEPKGIITK